MHNRQEVMTTVNYGIYFNFPASTLDIGLDLEKGARYRNMSKPIINKVPPHIEQEITAEQKISGVKFTRVQSKNVKPTPVSTNAPTMTERQMAELHKQQAITEWETPFNRTSYEDSEALNYSRQASQYWQQGRTKEAEALYKQALVVAEQTAGQDTPALITCLEDLTGFYMSCRKMEEAEPLVARLVSIRARISDADDSLLLAAVDNLAEIYKQTDRLGDAITLYKFMLARQADKLGTCSLVLVGTMSRLSYCYRDQGNWEAAETMLLKCLETEEAHYGRSALEVTTTLEDIAEVYLKQEKFDQTAEVLERKVHIYEGIYGASSLEVASCVLKLAELLSKVNMVMQAEPLYRRVVDIYKSARTKDEFMGLARSKTAELHLSATGEVQRISRRSADKPIEQEQCRAWPAIVPVSARSSASVDTTLELEIPAMPAARIS